MRISELLQDKKALITDLDGTLVDLKIDWDSLRERVRKAMGWEHPLKPLGVSIPQAARNEEEVRKAFLIVEEAELEAAERAKPDAGLREFLNKMKDRGIKLGLVTMQASRPARRALEKLGVLDLFDVIVTRDQSLNRKEQILLVLKKLGVDPKNCIFVGDMSWDVNAGKELGCLTVCVREEVQGADIYVRKLEDLAIDE